MIAKQNLNALTLQGTVMKKLKVLTSPVFIALICFVLQMAHGMEDSPNPAEQGVKRHFFTIASDTEYSQQKKRRYVEDRENPFKWCLEDITFNILEHAAIDNYLSTCSFSKDGNIGNLGAVCQDWRRIMEQAKMRKSIESIKHTHISQRFLKGILIYRPNKENDEGRVDLPIASLVNPLEGTFDLSGCGDTSEYFSISTGYRKKKKAGNANKVEIWLTPRFLVEKEINGSAQHFKKIFPSKWPEKASVGIFWTWGSWDNLSSDFSTKCTWDMLGAEDLYSMMYDSAVFDTLKGMSQENWDRFAHNPRDLEVFHIHFPLAEYKPSALPRSIPQMACDKENPLVWCQEEITQRFLKGVLVYQPNKGSDEGRVDLPIASLANPLEGTFDLSGCGKVGKYLSISTGYRKEKKKGAKSVEIWITPRFLVEKEINGSARHFKKIFPSKWPEKASVGIFWTWGSWDNMEWYDYLTTNTIDELGNNNLYEKLNDAELCYYKISGTCSKIGWPSTLKTFYIYFVD